VILIGGTRLAELMIEYNVGVSTVRTIAIKRVDSDYFEEWQPKTPTRSAVTWFDGTYQVNEIYEKEVPAMFVPSVFSFATEGRVLRYGSIRILQIPALLQSEVLRGSGGDGDGWAQACALAFWRMRSSTAAS